jgi:hypothetical protein
MPQDVTFTAGSSLLEQAATAVALDIMPDNINKGPAEYGIDFPALIELIMTIVQQVLANCPASDSAMAASFKRPNILQRVALMAQVKEYSDCCGNPSTRRHAGAIQRSMLARAAEADALKLVQEARGFDYLLV